MSKERKNIPLSIKLLCMILIGLATLLGLASFNTKTQTVEALEADYYRNYFEGYLTIGDSGTFPGTNITWRVEPWYYTEYLESKLSIVSLPSSFKLIISGTGAIPDFNDTDNKSPFFKREGAGINTVGNKYQLYQGKVIIEEGITRIGAYAFYGLDGWIESFPSTLKSIGDYAFYEMTQGIHYDVFSDDISKINEKYYFNDGLQSIGKYAFARTGTNYALISDTVTEIGEGAFSECEYMREISIGNSVKNIGKKAFYNCGSKDELYDNIYLNNIKITEITIPSSVIMVGDSAFENCFTLKQVNIQTGVKYIGADTFKNCYSLKRMTIPDTIKSIGANAFRGTAISEFIIDKNFDFSCADATAFYGTWFGSSCSGTFSNGVNWEYIAGSHTMTVTGTGEIPDESFIYNQGIEIVYISNGITKIGKKAFYDCDNIKEIYIGTGLTHIADETFGSCERLQVLNCDSQIVRSIGVDNFKVGYTKFYAKTNTMFELYAEYYDMEFCSTGDGHADLEFSGKAGECDYTFDFLSGVLTISGTGILEEIDEHDEIRSVVKEIVIEDGVTVIEKGAIAYYPLIEQLTIPDSVEEIKSCAFPNNPKLHTITIGTGLTTLGYNAFCWNGNEGLLYSELTETLNRSLKSIIFKSNKIEYFAKSAFSYSNITNKYYSMTISNGRFVDAPLNKVERPFPLNIYCYSSSIIAEHCLSEYKKLQNLVLNPLDKTGKAGDCTWNYDGNTLTVTGSGKMRNYTSTNTVPWKDLDFKNVVIGEYVTFIGSNSFVGKWLDSITILNANCNIYNSASTLGSANLIKSYAFSNVEEFATRYGYSFKSISETGETGSVNWYFDKSSGTMTIAGTGAMADYLKAMETPWKKKTEDINRVIIKDGVTSVGNFAFANCINLTEIEIASSVKIIGRYAFAYTDSLSVVTLPEGVEYIYDFAFHDSGLIKITIPKSVKLVYYSAFGYQVDERGYFTLTPDFVVGGYSDTYAETYSSENGLTFIDREKYCFIEYVANGGTGSMEKPYEIVKKNSIYYFPDCTITAPEGYAWSWWNVNDKPVVREGFKVEHDCIIAPAWGRACVYSFDAGIGSGSMDSIVYGEGRNIKLPECTMTPPYENWQFDQWEINDSVNGKSFRDPGTEWTVRENTTLIARWKIELNITIMPGVGSGEPISYVRSLDQKTRLPGAYVFTPPAKGFELAYWIVSDVDGERRCELNEILTVKSDTKITAVWWAKVIASGNGGVVEIGSTEDITRFVYGENYTLPAVYVKQARNTGMVFVGWNYGKGKGQPGDVVKLTGPTVLDALWAYQDTKVSFSAGNGIETSPIADKVYSNGAFLILPECPYTPPTGMAFCGWKASSSMYANNLQPGQLISITYNEIGESATVGSLVFTAQYSGDVRIKFNLNGHVYVYGESVADRIIPYGSKFTDLPDSDDVGAYAASGLIFKGWFYDKECTEPFDEISAVTSNLTLYACWEEGYKVAFWDRGYWVDTLEVEPDDTIVAPVITPRDGEVFEGWYYIDDGEWKEFDFDTMIKKDWTLYSVYKDVARLSFEENITELVRGRTYPFFAAIYNDENLPYGSKVSWTSSNPSVINIREYSDEVNWTSYADLIVADNAPFNASVTITFKAGNLEIKQEVHIKETFPLVVCGVEVTEKNRKDILGDGNISFDGNKTLTLKGGKYDKGITSYINGLIIKVDGNTTFENLDEDNDDYCRINLYKNTTITGFGILKVNSVNVYEEGALYFEGDTLTIDHARMELSGESGLIAPEGYGDKELVIIDSNINIQTKQELGEDMGYAIFGFEGGVTLTDCAVVNTNSSMLKKRSLSPQSTFIGKAIIQSTIPVEMPEFTVSFDMQSHGEAISSQTLQIGSKVEKPDDPTSVDYDFIGWYIDEKYSEIFDFDTEITKNTTIFAKWEIKTFTVKFMINGLGETPEKQILNYGVKVTKPADLSMDGFVFCGWFTDNIFYDTPYNFDNSVSKDLTIYALWKKVFSISFESNGGTGEMSGVENLTDKYTLPACSFVAPDGLQFKCWRIGNNDYKVGQSILGTRDIVAKAIWFEPVITVEIDEETAKTDGLNVSDSFERAKENWQEINFYIGDVVISFNNDAVNIIAGNEVNFKVEIKTDLTDINIDGAQLIIEISMGNILFMPGKAIVTVPFDTLVPEGKIAKVYYVDYDGNKTDMNATFENGKAIFETSHFSKYVIEFEDANATPTDPTTPENPETPATNKNKGLSAGAIVGIVIASLAVLGGAGFCVYYFVIRKKKIAK